MYIYILDEELRRMRLDEPRFSPCGNFASVMLRLSGMPTGAYLNDADHSGMKRVPLIRTMDGRWRHKKLSVIRYPTTTTQT